MGTGEKTRHKATEQTSSHVEERDGDSQRDLCHALPYLKEMFVMISFKKKKKSLGQFVKVKVHYFQYIYFTLS